MIGLDRNKFRILLVWYLTALTCFTTVSGWAAESFQETCSRRPTLTGWLQLGDRNRLVWNETGWMEVAPGRRVMRIFRQLQNALKPSEKFYFEIDVMASALSSFDHFYYGLMTPEGDKFANFIGLYAHNNAFSAAVVKKNGELVQGKATPLTAPFIVRLVGEYDGVSKLTVKVLDLLQNKKVLSTSELNFDPSAVSFSMMTVAGVGLSGNKTEDKSRLRVDNLYFSTTGMNQTSAMPTFLESEMVKVVSITPIPTTKGVKIVAEIDSLIDAEVEIKGAILPDKKLKGDEIWTGSMGVLKLARGVRATIEYPIDNIDAAMPWSPATPRLYNLTLTGSYKGKVVCSETVRFGFRIFESHNGNFYLNGRPIFLRGASLNPPAKGVLENIGQRPSFIRDYLRDLKLRNVNIIRMQSQNYDDLKRWLDVCDELGIMVFQGCYGVPPDGTPSEPPKDKDIAQTIQTYREKYFKNYIHHPSVVLYVLADEVGRSGNDRAVYDAWLGRLYKRIKKFNPSVAYMGNAGVESCTAGDVSDYHFYAGWYYGSFLDYLNFRNPVPATDGNKLRPLTVSECVGAFTTEKNGFPVRDRQAAAGLTWGGNEAANSKAALRYQSFLTKQAIEQFRRMREYNPRLAGIMPYTVLYTNWQRVRTFSDMRPKPAADQMRISFQPILVSWECWTPNVYTGSDFSAMVHIINDSDSGEELTTSTLVWELADNNGTVLASDKITVPLLKYYQSKSFPVKFKIDPKLDSGIYRLRGDLKWGGRLIASNEILLYLANRKTTMKNQADNSAVRLYDPTDKLKPALAQLGIRYAEVLNFSSLRDGNVLVLGEVDVNAIAAEKETVQKFIAGGGRVLVLCPKDNLLDFLGVASRIKMVPLDPKDGVFINQARAEDILFQKLPENAMAYWNDYTGWNESKPGMPLIAPVTAAMALRDQDAVGKTAILANFGRGLSNIALAEVFSGEGSVMVSGFDFMPRIAQDPVADRFFLNLISYACSKKKHFRFVSVGEKITWGDLRTERGVINNLLAGLRLYGQKTGWKDSPMSDEWVARGRELFGPFRFTSDGDYYCFDSSPLARAVFGMRVLKEWAQMTTTVRNPSKQTAELTLQLNQSPVKSITLGAGETKTISSLLPAGSHDIEVVFKGTRGLILVSSQFE